MGAELAGPIRIQKKIRHGRISVTLWRFNCNTTRYGSIGLPRCLLEAVKLNPCMTQPLHFSEQPTEAPTGCLTTRMGLSCFVLFTWSQIASRTLPIICYILEKQGVMTSRISKLAFLARPKWSHQSCHTILAEFLVPSDPCCYGPYSLWPPTPLPRLRTYGSVLCNFLQFRPTMSL